MAWMWGLFKNALAALFVFAVTWPVSADGFAMRRGINFSQWETWPQQADWRRPEAIIPFPEWRKTVTADDIGRLKAAGLDFVRMPVDPRIFLAHESQALRASLLDEVKQAVRFVTGEGLNVIVDLHTIPDDGPLGVDAVLRDGGTFERYLALVADMAGLVAEAPADKVALGLINEPIIACDGGKGWPERLKALHAAARDAAPAIPLVLTGGCWGSAESLVSLDPAMTGDANIIWEFHSYAPFLLTHQGATWAGDFIPHVTGLPYPPSTASPDELKATVKAIKQRFAANLPRRTARGHTAYLDELLGEIDTPEKLAAAIAAPIQQAAEWADKHGIPRDRLLLGEFGMIRQEYGNAHVVPAADRAAYYRDAIAAAEKRGIAWAMWSYSGAFGIIEEFEGRKAEPDVLDMVGGLGGGEGDSRTTLD
jgi:hypothetical protein